MALKTVQPVVVSASIPEMDVGSKNGVPDLRQWAMAFSGVR